MKCHFFQVAVMSILLYGCTTLTLTKRREKKLDGNYTRMLWAISNKSWGQHPTKQQLYSHLPAITKTIQVRWTGHVGHRWRSRDKLISDVLLWTPSHGWAKAGCIFVADSHQTGLDTRSNTQRLIKVGIEGRGRSGMSQDSNPAGHWPTKCNMGLMSQAVSQT